MAGLARLAALALPPALAALPLLPLPSPLACLSSLPRVAGVAQLPLLAVLWLPVAGLLLATRATRALRLPGLLAVQTPLDA
ncbi:MAG TPA: hypothetical protein VE258_07010, partial [Ktedonobacterales bacterium]|nr:hypothetical protein [Ktedonobacterales bacterium]